MDMEASYRRFVTSDGNAATVDSGLRGHAPQPAGLMSARVLAFPDRSNPEGDDRSAPSCLELSRRVILIDDDQGYCEAHGGR